MMFFETRKLAREFSTKKEKFQVVDKGTSSAIGQRWAVSVL